MKLALGTAQFGLDYGIANTVGQVTPDEIGRILDEARAAGIDTVDTAIAYGDSEARLGAAGLAGFRVISKLPPLDGKTTSIRGQIESSLNRLRIRRLDGLLLHRSADLSGQAGDAVFRSLSEASAAGLVDKIGVSIYDPEELPPILERYEIQLVQAPLNLLDRRLVHSGWLDRLAEMKVEVHTRSAFLQGLLLLGPHERPPKFARWGPIFDEWDAWLSKHGISRPEAALAFPCSQALVDHVVVGVDSLRQLRELVRASEATGLSPPETIATTDTRLINPANWNYL